MAALSDLVPCPAEWPRAAMAALAAAVFAALDVVDVLLCLVYGVLDGFLEESPLGCYCHRSQGKAAAAATGEEEDDGVSDTLYVRRSACRDALLRLVAAVGGGTRRKQGASPAKARSPRWSDCGCGKCRAWRASGAGGDRLRFVLQEPTPPSKGAEESARGDNAIFIHGFTSSSSFWAQTVFPEPAAASHRRLIAVDLLGFGDSPKPANCAYTLRDHVEAIERSLLDPLHLSSFHLVSHSMGCTIAIALAAKHPARVKSITLVAPPYFLPCEERASQVALRRLAEKKLWPPLLFGSAVMSWYEHIGRTICFVVCKNHRFWEWLIRIATRTSGVDIAVRDLTRHTHHSAWHTMHNVICGGARAQDRNLEALAAAGVPVRAVHGDGDQVVPVECSSRHLKSKLPHAEVRVVGGRDHRTVVFGREEELAQELRAFWSGCEKAGCHSVQNYRMEV
ncbi:lipase 1 [Hordeum vulgare]|nr:lipase 1 [Hordeum vulgare]